MRKLFLAAILFSSLPASAGVLFIAHKSVTLPKIDHRLLREIYLKKQRYWPDGQKIRPLDRSVGSIERMDFLTAYLEMSELQCVEYWLLQKQQTGNVQPMQVTSEQMMIHLVETMPGAIGYIRGQVNKGQVLLNRNVRIIDAIP